MDPAASITPLSQHLSPPPPRPRVPRGHSLLGQAPVTPGSAVPPLLCAPAPPQLVPSRHACPARDQPAQPHWSSCPCLAPGPPPPSAEVPTPGCHHLVSVSTSAHSCLAPAPDKHVILTSSHSSKYLWVPPRARPCARCPGVSKVPGPCFRGPLMQRRSRLLRDHRSLHLPRYPNHNCASSPSSLRCPRAGIGAGLCSDLRPRGGARGGVVIGEGGA